MLGIYTSPDRQVITPLIRVRLEIRDDLIEEMEPFFDFEYTFRVCNYLTYINDVMAGLGQPPFVKGDFKAIHAEDIEKHGLTYCLRRLNKSLVKKGDVYHPLANRLAWCYALGFISLYEEIYWSYFPDLKTSKNYSKADRDLIKSYKILPNFIIKERL